MAKGRDWLGKLNINYWLDEIKNSSNKSKAIKTVQDAMDAANYLGISDNDQKGIVKIIKAYEDKYVSDDQKEGFKRIYNTWDPSKNHINSAEYSDALSSWIDLAQDPGIYYTGASIPTTENPKKYENKVVTSVNSDGTKHHLGEGPGIIVATYDKPTKTEKVEKPKKTETKTTYNIADDPAYKKLLAETEAAKKYAAEQNKKFEDVLAIVEDLRRPRDSKEMADHFGIDLDQDLFLKEYNDATNQYFNEATAYQNKLRDQYVRNTAGQYDNAYNSYLDTYQNAAPTAAGKGIRAANMLSSALQGQQTMQTVDQGMLQSVNDINEYRKKELADNPNRAAQRFATLAAYLQSAGMQANASDVKGYAAAIKAASNMNLTNREYASQLAQNAATRYQGLANAASTAAQAQANNNNFWYQLQDWYTKSLGSSKAGAKATWDYFNMSTNN